ncbi:hypothetical protein AVEN_37089-1 [Araneus ventricosus]|uniref:Uncharacterized protein n=1 Tax=Araneus ventricosus TaxID=182803 RepID=A0A4Y2HPY6_ARAVE|nr:hypothetical protein AVEN_37089-1 [Araneus ventricosus]
MTRTTPELYPLPKVPHHTSGRTCGPLLIPISRRSQQTAKRGKYPKKLDSRFFQWGEDLISNPLKCCFRRELKNTMQKHAALQSIFLLSSALPSGSQPTAKRGKYPKELDPRFLQWGEVLIH